MEKIVVYAAEGCPKCAALKKRLVEDKIDYEICTDVDLMLEKGFEHVPMMEVDGAYLNYKSALKWLGERESV